MNYQVGELYLLYHNLSILDIRFAKSGLHVKIAASGRLSISDLPFPAKSPSPKKSFPIRLPSRTTVDMIRYYNSWIPIYRDSDTPYMRL